TSASSSARASSNAGSSLIARRSRRLRALDAREGVAPAEDQGDGVTGRQRGGVADDRPVVAAEPHDGVAALEACPGRQRARRARRRLPRAPPDAPGGGGGEPQARAQPLDAPPQARQRGGRASRREAATERPELAAIPRDTPGQPPREPRAEVVEPHR